VGKYRLTRFAEEVVIMHSNPVKLAAIAAFGAAAFYKASTIVEIFFQNTILASWLGVVSILLLFPVIAMLPSKSWARASGYAYCTLESSC
jgi:hypothetical protein